MNESGGQAGHPIPADVIEQLTAVASRMAAASHGEIPAEAAVVETTQAEALDLLFHAKIPGSEHRRVYVITMTGRFFGRGNPVAGAGPPPQGCVKTATFEVGTLRGLDTKISDQDDRALLTRLGPVTILPILTAD